MDNKNEINKSTDLVEIVGIQLKEAGMPVKGRIDVDDVYCKGCELCASVCPQKVIHMAPDRITAKGFHPAELMKEGCTGCGVCAVMCPEAAITVYRETQAARAAAGA
ncbi:4Fe-4S dicluster domain-containing protein [Longilinea arvoryzae]|nr:4Fe-4S dicluster domain-containing protein [Longilinea arvoryzae]